MLLKMFSIYDCKVETYTVPYYYKTRGEAVRSIIDLLKEGKHEFAQHPEDYTMFELGSFDLSKAEFHLDSTPISVGKLLEFMPS